MVEVGAGGGVGEVGGFAEEGAEEVEGFCFGRGGMLGCLLGVSRLFKV